MNPEHHEERLRMWAVVTGRPVLALDYGKAPECESTAILNVDTSRSDYFFLYSGRSIPIC